MCLFHCYVLPGCSFARITFADNSHGKEVSCTKNIDDASFQNIQNAEKQLTSQLPDGNQLSIISFEKTEAHKLNKSFLKLDLSKVGLVAR